MHKRKRRLLSSRRTTVATADEQPPERTGRAFRVGTTSSASTAAALLASAIDAYRERLRLLARLGADVMRYATALALCPWHLVNGSAP
jgi:hypothetical protein